MLLTSTQTLTDQPYEALGLVRAASVYSKNIAKDIGQSLKSVVGGELRGYTTSNVTEYGTEVIAWGTAVKFV